MTRARSLSRLANSNVFTVSTTDNRVGIGSTIPDAKLDVGGDILVGTAITLGNVSGIVSATDFYVNGVSITGAAGTWATFTSGGEGGISTTKKVKIENGLEVTGISTFSGDLTVGGVLTYDDVTNVDSIGIITARSYVSIADSILHTGDTNTSIRFPAADTFTIETAGSEALRVTGDQRVGIGTDDPTRQLEVFNTTNAIINLKSDTQSSVIFSDHDDINIGMLIYDHSSDSMQFRVNDAERVRITSSGGVGIGTTDTTGAKLVVGEGTPNGSGGLRVINSDNNFSAGKECAFMDYTGSAVRLGHLNGASGSAKKIQFLTGGGSKIEIDGGGHLYPSTDNSVNLGFSTARWANIYSADLQLSNEGSSNDVDGTWGQYTIQEGENDLFLLNRRNGKKYKFVLQEVN